MAPLHRARHWSLSLDVELPCLARPAKPPISDYPALSPYARPTPPWEGGSTQRPKGPGCHPSCRRSVSLYPQLSRPGSPSPLTSSQPLSWGWVWGALHGASFFADVWGAGLPWGPTEGTATWAAVRERSGPCSWVLMVQRDVRRVWAYWATATPVWGLGVCRGFSVWPGL